MALFAGMLPTVFAAEKTDNRQITIQASELEKYNDEADMEAMTKELCEQYGLEYTEETEDPEFGYFTEEDRRELGLDEGKGKTKDNISSDYIFLDFNVGSSSREMNWQIKSNYTSESSRLYYSNNKQGYLAGTYQGSDARLYMPIETGANYIESRLKGYTLKSGDICRIYIGSVTANTLFTSGGTESADSYLAMHCSLNQGAWTKFGPNTKITYKTGAHTEC